MNAISAIVCVLLVLAATHLASIYLQRSIRSYASAERAWPKLNAAATRLLNRDIDADLAHNVLLLVYAAGCGCFVRSMLLQHYFPFFIRKQAVKNEDIERGFRQIENLDVEARADFHELVSLVMIYDSFRNPLQGWLFRSALRSIVHQQTFRQMREAELASYSVLMTKQKFASAI